MNEIDMKKFAQKLGEQLQAGDVIVLTGELGSGKTTFTKGLGLGLGIHQMIKSPTYTIVREYEGRLPLYHMDVYRLDGDSKSIGFEDYFNKDAVCIIEWADMITDCLPEERLQINFKIVDENTRVLILTPYGEKYEDLLNSVL